MPQPWDPQPGEKPTAFAAFATYRDLGPTRSLDKAYRAQTGRTTRAPGRWKVWYSANRWRNRADEWDRNQQQVARNAADKAIGARAIPTAESRARFTVEERELHEILGSKLREARDHDYGRRRTAISPDGRNVIFYEALMKGFTAWCQGFRQWSDMGRRMNNMPTVVDDDAPPEDLKNLFFETDGQLEAALPEGAMPPMPADVLEKPDIPASSDTAGPAPVQPPPLPRDVREKRDGT